jgi:hypothetical protein
VNLLKQIAEAESTFESTFEGLWQSDSTDVDDEDQDQEAQQVNESS